MAEPINYEAVIADLEARREALDKIIAGLKEVSHTFVQSVATAQVDVRPDLPAAHVTRSDAFFGMTIPDAIRKYLTMAKRPQSPKAIATALELGGLPHQSKNFYGTVFTALKRQEGKDLVKVKSEWALSEWYSGLRKTSTKGPAKTDDQNTADQNGSVDNV